MITRGVPQVGERARPVTGTEILARQKEAPPSRAVEQARPIRYGGGNSPVRHQVVVAPEDAGKIAIWQSEGYLAPSPVDVVALIERIAALEARVTALENP